MPRRVVLLFNPASGRGKAGRFADALTKSLDSDGWVVERELAISGAPKAEYVGASAVIIIGGDGTVHHAAHRIAEAGVPMIIAPMGTENLLAKELGMRAQIDQIRSALRYCETTRIDLPTVNGVPFLVMCSIGLDAAVVAEVGLARTGRIRKSTYIGPLLRQAFRPTLPQLRVIVDGQVVTDWQRGMLVIANCRRYAVGLNPARDASMMDQRLDAVFLPMRSTLDALRWALRCRLGEQASAPGFIAARGRVIEIENTGDTAAPMQVDGEPAPAGMTLPFRFIADANSVSILCAPTLPNG